MPKFPSDADSTGLETILRTTNGDHIQEPEFRESEYEEYSWSGSKMSY